LKKEASLTKRLTTAGCFKKSRPAPTSVASIAWGEPFLAFIVGDAHCGLSAPVLPVCSLQQLSKTRKVTGNT